MVTTAVPANMYVATEDLRTRLRWLYELEDGRLPGLSRDAMAAMAREALLGHCVHHGLLALDEFFAPRRRADKAAAKARQRNGEETVIKACLGRLLRGMEHKAVVVGGIRRCVEYISKLAHRGSMVVRVHLQRLLDAGAPLPDLENVTFFRRCFMADCDARTDPEMSATVLANVNLLGRSPPAAPFTGLSNMVTYAAKTYQTAFLNNLLARPTFSRIQNYCGAWLRLGAPRDQTGVDGPGPYDLLRAVVQGGAVPTSWSPMHCRFVDTLREDLELRVASDKLTERHLKEHRREALRFTFALSSWFDNLRRYASTVGNRPATAQERKGGRKRRSRQRGVQWCPLHRIRAHHVCLDAKLFREVLRGVGLFKKQDAAAEGVDDGISGACADEPPKTTAKKKARAAKKQAKTPSERAAEVKAARRAAVAKSAAATGDDDLEARALWNGYFGPGIAAVAGKVLAPHQKFLIDTDGVGASVHFLRPMTKRQLAERERRRAAPTAAMASARTKCARKAAAVPARGEPRRGARSAGAQRRRSLEGTLMLVVDPGRVNLVYMAEFRDGRPTGRRWKLTARQYYRASGVSGVSERLRKRRQAAGLAEVDRAAAEQGGLTKTADAGAFARYAGVYQAASER